MTGDNRLEAGETLVPQVSIPGVVEDVDLTVPFRVLPSSEVCSNCERVLEDLKLYRSRRSWSECGVLQGWNTNTPIFLKQLATVKTALPLTSLPGNGNATIGVAPFAEGEVTPTRHENMPLRAVQGRKKSLSIIAHFLEVSLNESVPLALLFPASAADPI
jgi:hypothetical protein